MANATNNATTAETAVFSKGVRRVLGLSLHGWENTMVVFLIVAGFFALIAGAATWAVVRLQRIELADSRNEFDKYKLTVAGQVADAKKEGIEAGKTAGNALLKAAELEKEAATARLETEKIKAIVAWRTFSESQAKDLERVLATKPGSVNLRWTDGDPEALFLAIQVSQVLQKANWRVAAGSFKPANQMLFGLILPPEAGDDADTLRQALSAARVSFSSIPVPQDGASFNVSTIAGAPILMIGSRLPVVP
jgi:hypothetical protein